MKLHNIKRIYVAYHRRSGIPYAASFDRDIIFDYAEEHELVVLDVEFLERSDHEV